MSYRDQERFPKKEYKPRETLPTVRCLRKECNHIGEAEISLSGTFMCSKCSTLSITSASVILDKETR
jgi:hypothetical protein